MTDLPLLEVQNLSFRYPEGGRGISDISFNAAAGEFILLTGATGSGKTLLIRHLNGLMRPQAGDVRFRGQSIYRCLPETRRNIGIVFQSPEAQFIGQTVYEDIAFGPQNLGWDSDKTAAACDAALRDFRLTELADRSPVTLSGGEKRLLAVAAVCVMRPSVLILDEPFANLDYAGVRAVLEALATIRGSGMTLFIACHDYEKVLGLTNRVLVLREGRLCADSPPEDVLCRLSSFGLTPPDYYAAEGPGLPGADFFSWIK